MQTTWGWPRNGRAWTGSMACLATRRKGQLQTRQASTHTHRCSNTSSSQAGAAARHQACTTREIRSSLLGLSKDGEIEGYSNLDVNQHGQFRSIQYLSFKKTRGCAAEGQRCWGNGDRRVSPSVVVVHNLRRHGARSPHLKSILLRILFNALAPSPRIRTTFRGDVGRSTTFSQATYRGLCRRP